MRDDKLHEECAIFGVSLQNPAAAETTCSGLLSLQHRGQEGAGIAVVHKNGIFCRKDTGLVSEVFSAKHIGAFPPCRVAVGHTRYSTTGGNRAENTGPFVGEFLTGRIATAHNGNITNAKKLREELLSHGLSFAASSDSEVASALLACAVAQRGDLIAGIAQAARRLQGAFSLIIASGDGTLVALRDPSGYRPLCIGHSDAGIAFASESCALDTCGFALERDVQPGEMVVAKDGEILSTAFYTKKDPAAGGQGLCVFEYVYFSRPDSVVDGLSVYEARRNMGVALAKEHPANADIVCGVPDSGLEAAAGFSAESGIALVPGFVKNRYIGRSFIYPSQKERDAAVNLKLNPLAATITDKRVVLVDDSIVRGTTSRQIVQSLKAAGAKEVHMRISSPPFLHTCHYGTDIGSEANLVANRMRTDELCRKIGADSLGYISVSGLQNACAKSERQLCLACFTGEGAPLATRKDVFEKG